MTEILDEELAEGATTGAGFVFVDARCAILALRQIEGDGAPGGGRQVGDFLEQSRGAPAQGQEDNVGVIETIKPFVSGELGVEDEMLRGTAVLAGPKVDEAEHLVGLFTLGDVGI